MKKKKKNFRAGKKTNFDWIRETKERAGGEWKREEGGGGLLPGMVERANYVLRRDDGANAVKITTAYTRGKNFADIWPGKNKSFPSRR